MDFLYDLHRFSDFGLLALRVSAGVIFIVHGHLKWSMWKPGAQGSMLQLMKFLAIAEPVMGVALIVGFLTQFAALGGVLIMLGAIYFKINAWKVPFRADNNTGWEFDLMILGGCLALLFAGGGGWALDALIWNI